MHWAACFCLVALNPFAALPADEAAPPREEPAVEIHQFCDGDQPCREFCPPGLVIDPETNRCVDLPPENAA